MNRKKAADSRLAGFLFVALSLLVFLLTAVLLFANVRLVPIQTDGVPIAPDALVWEVTKLEGEGTVLVEGAVLLPGADTISVSITALLRDPETGQCYRIPTALRTPDMLSILPKDPVLSLEESRSASA